MTSRPSVSAIMIFWNAERFIAEAIESVLAQTYRKWELLLIDDGSTDASTAIAKSYVRRHSGQIRYYEHPAHANLGMSAARNLGLQQARGEFVSFLDSDDVWLPPKLERQIELLVAHPHADVVCGPTRWWYSWTGHESDRHRDSLRELFVTGSTLYQPPELFYRFLRGEVRTPATCSPLIRSSAIKAVGGCEVSFEGMYEDQVLFAKLYAHASVFVTDQCWDNYRQHHHSHCAVSDRAGSAHWGDENAQRQIFLAWLHRYVREQCLSTPQQSGQESVAPDVAL